MRLRAGYTMSLDVEQALRATRSPYADWVRLVPTCIRGINTRGACRSLFQFGVGEKEVVQHTLTLAASSNPAFASADHMSYCPLFLTASVTSSRALPAPGCVGSTILFSGPLRSFRAILSSRSFSRELTRDLRGRAWTAGTAER